MRGCKCSDSLEKKINLGSSLQFSFSLTAVDFAVGINWSIERWNFACGTSSNLLAPFKLSSRNFGTFCFFWCNCCVSRLTDTSAHGFIALNTISASNLSVDRFNGWTFFDGCCLNTSENYKMFDISNKLSQNILFTYGGVIEIISFFWIFTTEAGGGEKYLIFEFVASSMPNIHHLTFKNEIRFMIYKEKRVLQKLLNRTRKVNILKW